MTCPIYHIYLYLYIYIWIIIKCEDPTRKSCLIKWNSIFAFKSIFLNKNPEWIIFYQFFPQGCLLTEDSRTSIYFDRMKIRFWKITLSLSHFSSWSFVSRFWVEKKIADPSRFIGSAGSQKAPLKSNHKLL